MDWILFWILFKLLNFVIILFNFVIDLMKDDFFRANYSSDWWFGLRQWCDCPYWSIMWLTIGHCCIHLCLWPCVLHSVNEFDAKCFIFEQCFRISWSPSVEQRVYSMVSAFLIIPSMYFPSASIKSSAAKKPICCNANISF